MASLSRLNSRKTSVQKIAVRLDAAKKAQDVATAEAIRLLLLHRDDPDFRVKEEIQRSLKKIDRRTYRVWSE